jgi:hypothetical protein
VLKLIGGLPQTRTPLAAKTYGVVQEDGFKVEKITYDSLPGYHVTANVYVPDRAGDGTVPGHHRRAGPRPGRQDRQPRLRGEPGRAGMIVLAYDIVSEGERLQHYDPELGASKVGRPTGEHSLAAWQTRPSATTSRATSSGTPCAASTTWPRGPTSTPNAWARSAARAAAR